jgi:hypothetical protein
MPFAKEFQRVMNLPGVGDEVGGFKIERFEIRHRPIGSSRYEYPVEYELHGIGGVQGVKKALKPITSQKLSTFSGFGTPYQLKFGRVEVEALGDRRYAAHLVGMGVGFDLKRELMQFAAFVRKEKLPIASEEIEGTIVEYIAEYKLDVRRKHRRLTPDEV